MITTIDKKDLKILYNQLKNSAKKRKIEFSLTLLDLYELSFPITCPIFNFPLYFNRGMVWDNSYSIDRIDLTKGYTKDNIIVISQKANKLKSNATLNELQRLVSFYTELERQNEH